MKAILTLFLFTIPWLTFGQSFMRIEGNIIDTNTQSGVQHVQAYLVRMNDSVLIANEVSDKEGKFSFKNVAIDTLRMILDHPKFERRELIFIGSENNSTFDIKNLVLFEKGKQMEEITIFAYKDPVHYKGDTLVYIADSFKTRPNAVVEDLLKKLPGVVVESDGTIKSQGKNVSRVFVDGDEFFGSDATLATKNLAASSIETVQVYETDLPDAQVGDEKVQIIDLKLKDEAKKGYFGKASFGTDFNRFYEGQLLTNVFTQKQKLSVYFLSGNTTKSALSWRDANQFGIQDGNAYSYNAETDSYEINDNFIRTEDGFPLLFKSGFFYSGQVSKKLKIGANYTYTDVRKTTEQSSRTKYFLPDTTFTGENINQNFDHFKQHEINLNFTYDIDSTQTITFDPKLAIRSKSSEYSSVSNFINSNEINERSSTNSTNSNMDLVNMKAKIGYTKKFKKNKRVLKVYNNFVSDNSVIDSDIDFYDYFSQTNLYSNQVQQKKNSEKNIYSNLFNATFVEPFSKKWKMEITYELFNTTKTQNVRSNNFLDGSFSELDSLTSGYFKSIKFQNKLGAAIVYDYKKHVLTIGAYARNVDIKNQNHFTHSTINQSITNVLPRLNYIWKIGRNAQFRSNVSTTSDLPDIELLQPIQNNSNPNNINIGNANLKPNYNLNLNISFNRYNSLSGGYQYGGIYGSYGWNSFISEINYDSLGRSISGFQNGNTLNYLGGWAGTGIPLIKQVLTLEPSLNYSHNNRYSLVNGERNAMLGHNFSGSLGLNLYADIIEVELSGDYTYSKNFNSINPTLNLTNHIYEASSDITVYMPWKMEFNTDFNYRKFSNLSDGFNVNMFIWNVGLEQSFGKNKNFILGVQLNDILNQNTKIERSAFSNFVRDSRTNIISRYFLVNFTYQFNSIYKQARKNKNNEETGE